MIVAAVLDLGLDLQVWPWVWLAVAVVFALVELTLLADSFILVPFAVSAFVASMLGFYDQPIEVQWLTFVAVGAGLFVVMFRWARRFGEDHATPPGVGADRLVGLIGTVTAAIDRDDADRRGRVRVVGEDWGALAEHESVIGPGARVRITAMRGTRVVVRSIDDVRPTTTGAPPP